MYLRCAECQATTWIATYEPVAGQDVVCQTCGSPLPQGAE